MGRRHRAQRHARDDDEGDWQALVGLSTDPTDTNSVFTATIAMVDGAPVVKWSPKMSAAPAQCAAVTLTRLTAFG